MQPQLEIRPIPSATFTDTSTTNGLREALCSHNVTLWPDSIAPTDLGPFYVSYDPDLTILLQQLERFPEPPTSPAPTPHTDLPAAIHTALWKAFPAQYTSICATIKRASDHWCFGLFGMYVGVEDDGYIHS